MKFEDLSINHKRSLIASVFSSDFLCFMLEEKTEVAKLFWLELAEASVAIKLQEYSDEKIEKMIKDLDKDLDNFFKSQKLETN